MRLLSRSTLAVAAALCMAAPAFADTIDTFTLTGVNVDSVLDNGTVLGAPDGTLTGTISIDITNGMYTSASITWSAVPGVFNDLLSQSVYNGDQYFADIENTAGYILNFDLPGASLIGYGGGTICSESAPCGGHTSGIVDSTDTFIGVPVSGSLVFASSIETGGSPTPEPSSLILLGTGVLGAIGAARRRFHFSR